MLIRTEALAHAHEGRPALAGVDLALAPGDHAVLLGANGSGKSTLLQLLNALMPPDTGRILYDGRALDAGARRDAAFMRRFRGETALLFQDPAAMLFHATVGEEIAYGPRTHGRDEPEARARSWAAEVGVDHLWDRAPYALSRGEQQRVALASLLVLEPRLLLLDEPTASLDPRSTGWLVDFLADLPATVLTATHNLSLALELGDRALVLDESHRLCYDGPADALRHDMGTLRRANLVHAHRHRHRDGAVEHSHDHTHDWG